MALLTQSEYARHRGCLPQDVLRAREKRIKDAEVRVGSKCLIDSDLADKLWDQGPPIRTRARRKTTPAAATTPDSPPDREPEPITAEVIITSEHQPSSKETPSAAAPAATFDLQHPPTNEALASFIEALPEDQIPDYNVSIRRKEHYTAECKRVDAMKARGEVGSVAEFEATIIEIMGGAREALQAMPSRISAQLAAATDPFICEQLLEQEIQLALRGFK